MAWKNSGSKKTYTEDSLYDYAVFMLGRRMRTVAELKRLMRGRAGHQPDCEPLVEAVIARLKQQRYVNDSQYAATYSALRRDNEKFGRIRVTQELRARGVHPEVIEKTVAEAYGEMDERELLRQFAGRKRLAPPTGPRDAERIFRKMARAGFSTRAILQWLRQGPVEEEMLSELEQARESEEAAADDGRAGDGEEG